MTVNDFSVTALLSNLSQLNRQGMIERLEEICKDHLLNGRKQRADKINGILAVIKSEMENPNSLTEAEKQEILPTMQRFMHEGSLDKGAFMKIFRISLHGEV